MNMKKLLVFILLTAGSIQIYSQSTAQYINLGFGGAAKVSNNGMYVVGSNYPSPGFLWSESTGRINLGNTYTEAFGVSNNGIVAGSFIDTSLHAPNGNATLRAGYYDGSRWIALEGFPGYPVLDEMSYTYGYGISEDGSIIVGMHWLPTYKAEACYWDSVGSIHMLGRTGGGSSRANDVAKTNNGFRIVGWDGEALGPGRRAFYWDPTPHFMGGYDTSYPDGECNGLNTDGSTLVGGSTGALFSWTDAGGMNWFNTTYLNGASYAKDISDNGIIVGQVSPSVGAYRAFIKRPEWSDIMLLKDYLVDSLGITEASDWLASFANSISADGLTIIGTAYPSSGGPIAYVIKFTDPLPVELSSFTASYENNVVNLNWITSTETNNQGFDIEKKNQNSEWTKIGFVPGKGSTTEINNYNFVDNSTTAGKISYRLKQIDFNGSFEYSNTIEVDVNPVNEFSLSQNYPNPFNPSTKISYTIPQSTNVKLSVFNTLGEKITELVNKTQDAGTYDIQFDASGLTSGIYFYRLEAGDPSSGSGQSFVSTQKMSLIK
ncbi:MAG: T9SS type A sorting domain-containing protein [Ignavibacteriota bacterium]